MLKLEKLELKNGFTGTESLIKSGIALVVGTDKTVASGNYMMHSSFGGVVAAINTSGDLAVPVSVFELRFLEFVNGKIKYTKSGNLN